MKVELVVPEVAADVQITMSMKEASALKSILHRLEGTETGPRGDMNELLRALRVANVPYHDLDFIFTGSITCPD